MRAANKNVIIAGVLVCLVLCGLLQHFMRPTYLKMGGNSIDLSIKVDISNARKEIATIDSKLETTKDELEIKNLAFRKSELEEHILGLIKKQDDMNDLLLQMPGQFMFAMFSGFKDVISGALWVRADEFFHNGDYQEIIPLVRLITWLDPHNIDVYNTGAWHMDYNFTDEKQRSDKRNLPLSVQLLKEGIAKNPDRWDLYFELGWVHYNRKLEDFDNSLKYIKEATKHDGYDSNTGKRIPRPEFVDRMLAHAYEASGDFDGAIRQWEVTRVRTELLLKDRDRTMDWSAGNENSFDVINKNLALLFLRKAWRYGDLDAYKKGLDLAKKSSFLDWAVAGAEKDYQARLASGKPFGDAKKPLNTNFTVNVKKKAPRILEISGTLNLANNVEYNGLASDPFTRAYETAKKTNRPWRDGCRVWWRISDASYKSAPVEGTWSKDPNQTLMWDSMYVREGKFKETIDFSLKEDKAFYPFASDKYKLTLWFVPAGTGVSDNVQDRIGWNGEAMRDKTLRADFIPGKNALVYEIELDRSDII